MYNINVPVYIHIDSKNLSGFLSWTCPFGHYIGGHMVVPQIGMKFLYPAGSIFGVDGRNIVHYATNWGGKNSERYVVGKSYSSYIRLFVTFYTFCYTT